jgi:hypothetical protein
MSRSMISRARLRDLTSLGRVALREAGGAASPEGHASPHRHLTAATSIGEAPNDATDLMSLRQPSVGRSRPARDDLMERHT